MLTCDRCGKPLPPGSTKYMVIIQAIADFDSFLGITDFKYSSDIQLEKLTEKLKNEPADKTMSDVFEKKALILCPSCKRAFMENPLYHVGSDNSPNGHILH